MKKFFGFLMLSLVLISCNAEKKQISEYLENNYSDREIEVVGDIVADSAFCPLDNLDNTSIEIAGCKAMLIHLLDADPDSAFKMARTLKAKYAGKNGFASIAYPKGKNNRMALMAKCKDDGQERVITFFKNTSHDVIEFSSLDVDEVIDSLLVNYTELMDGIEVILQDKAASRTEEE